VSALTLTDGMELPSSRVGGIAQGHVAVAAARHEEK
jgi:hypothetical protein